MKILCKLSQNIITKQMKNSNLQEKRTSRISIEVKEIKSSTNKSSLSSQGYKTEINYDADGGD